MSIRKLGTIPLYQSAHNLWYRISCSLQVSNQFDRNLSVEWLFVLRSLTVHSNMPKILAHGLSILAYYPIKQEPVMACWDSAGHETVALAANSLEAANVNIIIQYNLQ